MIARIRAFTNELKYSSVVAARFALKGDIHDLKSSDSILQEIAKRYNYRDAAIFSALVPRSISQHKFNEADTFLNKAKQIGLKAYDESALSFDINFELGRYFLTANNLNKKRAADDYGYQFRLSKQEHYKGNPDSAVYEANVSGKPLEGIELYWIGKFMKGLGKGYSATEFFKAAEKNKYDLSPSMMKDLDDNLKE